MSTVNAVSYLQLRNFTEQFHWICLQGDVELLLVTVNNRLIFGIKIVHDLSCQPILPVLWMALRFAVMDPMGTFSSMCNNFGMVLSSFFFSGDHGSSGWYANPLVQRWGQYGLSYKGETVTRWRFREGLSLEYLHVSFKFRSRVLDTATTEYAKLAYIANVQLEWQF